MNIAELKQRIRDLLDNEELDSEKFRDALANLTNEEPPPKLSDFKDKVVQVCNAEWLDPSPLTTKFSFSVQGYLRPFGKDEGWSVEWAAYDTAGQEFKPTVIFTEAQVESINPSGFGDGELPLITLK